MNCHECPFEAEVLQAIDCRDARPMRLELAAHVAGCAVCSDLAVVAAAFDGARAELVAAADLPDAGRVWRRAQVRAQREAIRAAGRPITAAQVIAFGAAMGLIGASVGATSTSLQAALAWAGGHWADFNNTAWPAGASAFLTTHWAFIAGVAAAVLLLPATVYAALRRE